MPIRLNLRRHEAGMSARGSLAQRKPASWNSQTFPMPQPVKGRKMEEEAYSPRPRTTNPSTPFVVAGVQSHLL